MEKYLEKPINELVFILGKVALAMMIFGFGILSALYQYHNSYNNPYKWFAKCSRRVSDTVTEIDTGELASFISQTASG